MKLFVLFSLCFYTFGSNAYYTSQSFTHLECKDSNDLVPKDDDGKNRYLLNILEVDKGFLADLRPCDSPVDDKPDPCDPYVIVKIDGKHVYRTKTHNNSGQFEPFNEQVQTGPISNSSIITLELWDNDVGHSHDDPMAKWSGNAQYFLRSTYLYSSGNMMKVDMDHDYSKKSNEIRLSFNIKAGEAWFDANSTTCDSPIDGNANLCDAYVTVKIDGKEVYRTKAQHDTDHPKFDEIFQTGWIDEYSFIEFEMWDSDVGDSPDDPMSTWSGYAQYFLTYDSFVGNVTDDEGIHRNSLIVSTKMEQRASGEIVQLLFNIADGRAKRDANTGTCVACNSYVTVTIDGKEVYRTKTHSDTNYPVFNEVFQSDWISVDAIVEFNMRGVSKESTDKLLSTWSGYAGCYLDHLRLPAPYSPNSLIVSTRLLDRKHPQDIKLSFNVTDGQAWLRADSTPCDPTNDGRYNPCDSGVLIKIDGKTAHSTYTEWDTDHPIFNKIFETGWMSKDAVITFEMWDGHVTIDEREVGTWHFMDGWSGNVDYYLAHETLVGSATDGNHRNSLNVSTKLIEKPEDAIIVQTHRYCAGQFPICLKPFRCTMRGTMFKTQLFVLGRMAKI